MEFSFFMKPHQELMDIVTFLCDLMCRFRIQNVRILHLDCQGTTRFAEDDAEPLVDERRHPFQICLNIPQDLFDGTGVDAGNPATVKVREKDLEPISLKNLHGCQSIALRLIEV